LSGRRKKEGKKFKKATRVLFSQEQGKRKEETDKRKIILTLSQLSPYVQYFASIIYFPLHISSAEAL
jgi:hypothetical protein